MLIKIFPFGSTSIDKIFVSGIFISETEAGVVTVTGSFFTNVDVNMKKVSSKTVTSLIARHVDERTFLFDFRSTHDIIS